MESDLNSSHEHLEKDFQSIRKIATELIHENAEYKNQLDEKERELDIIYTVIRRITYLMDWNEIQEMIVDIIMDFFPVVHFCMIALYEEPDSLTLRYKERGKEALFTDRLGLPFGVDEDTKWDQVVTADEWSDYFRKHDSMKTLQSSFIPLATKEKEIGFLMIGKPREVEYGRGEWRFLHTIANYCAVTLDNSKLYHLATTDPLTGLFNRRYFLHRLDREVERAARRGTPLSLLMLDLDHFKRINDDHGHPAGDQVLCILSRRLTEAARGGLVCRIGGEEFAILFSNMEKSEAVERAEEVRKAVGAAPFLFTSDGEEISRTITISIGISVFPQDAFEPENIINKADQALYIAKAQGRNQVVSHQ